MKVLTSHSHMYFFFDDRMRYKNYEHIIHAIVLPFVVIGVFSEIVVCLVKTFKANKRSLEVKIQFGKDRGIKLENSLLEDECKN